MEQQDLRIDTTSAEPIYRQIVGQVRRLVASGSLASGAELPPVRAVASLHGINPMTVSKAYQRLVLEGLARHERGSAVRIAHGPAEPGARCSMLDDQLRSVILSAQDLGFSSAEVLDRLRLLLETPEVVRRTSDTTARQTAARAIY